MSASATGQWEVPNHQFELAQRQARAFGCIDDTIENIMECFKTVILTFTVILSKITLTLCDLIEISHRLRKQFTEDVRVGRRSSYPSVETCSRT